jgi:L-threonylcarbamoyladenylate synthase
MDIKDISSDKIGFAVNVLKKGGVILFPTETSYGLAADATNNSAVERIMFIKSRPLNKTLPIIVSDMSMAEKYAELTPIIKNIAEKYWPGPLTVVIPVKKQNATGGELSKLTIHNDDTVAIRVSSHPVADALLKGLGKPIISTSANITGKPECYSADDCLEQFKNDIFKEENIIDMGNLPIKKPSTIICEKNGKIQIIRQGEIIIPSKYVEE